MAADLIAACMIAVAAGLLFIVGASFFVRYREKAADAHFRVQWEQEVAGTTMPPWDGLTYDWPETGVAQFLAGKAATAEFPVYREPDFNLFPVPVSSISGPFRMLAPAQETGAAISDMVARTDAFIATLGCR
jgi:hypothetical protein